MEELNENEHESERDQRESGRENPPNDRNSSAAVQEQKSRGVLIQLKNQKILKETREIKNNLRRQQPSQSERENERESLNENASDRENRTNERENQEEKKPLIEKIKILYEEKNI